MAESRNATRQGGPPAPPDDPWLAARALVDGWKGGINIAHEALDRHVIAGHSDDLAIRWLAKDGTRRDLAYADMTAAGDGARSADGRVHARVRRRGDHRKARPPRVTSEPSRQHG